MKLKAKQLFQSMLRITTYRRKKWAKEAALLAIKNEYESKRDLLLELKKKKVFTSDYCLLLMVDLNLERFKLEETIEAL